MSMMRYVFVGVRCFLLLLKMLWLIVCLSRFVVIWMMDVMEYYSMYRLYMNVFRMKVRMFVMVVIMWGVLLLVVK